MIQEITAQELDTENYIDEKVKQIQEVVKDKMAINALSGGVDSSTVTMLGHRALGDRLKTVFIENGLMREGESEKVVGLFKKLGVTVDVVDAQKEFFAAKELRIRKRSAKRLPRLFTETYSGASSRKVAQNIFSRGPF